VAAPVAAKTFTGLVLGRYRALRPLGSGGSGSVWLALDERSGLEVALKVVDRDGKTGARAEREAMVAARLRHDRCQRTYQLATDDEHVYIAYEYVPGCNLRQAMRAGKLDDATAIEAAAQVLEALAYAHSRGIVHRDVKPANVLLADGDEVSIRLLDFGLAQLHGADPLTEHGDIPGTLAYISPERLRGDSGGPTSDVWAVGVMLWEALAGWHPFWAPSLTATAKKIKAGAPPLEAARRDLPRPLLATVNRALDREPAERPPADELAERLRRATAARRRQPTPRAAVRGPAIVRRGARRVLPAVFAALFTAWFTATFPFFPVGWAVGLALAAAGLTLLHERAGLAVALAAPVFPLGNLSRGLALLYIAGAAVWLLVHWRRPRWALLAVWGPVLGPLSLLGFLPLLVQPARGAWRRALQAGAAVLLAGLVAGVEGWRLPLPGGSDSQSGPDIAGVERATTAARILGDALLDQPHLLGATALLAGTAAVLPLARNRGPWGLAALAVAALTAALLPTSTVEAVPLVACVWLTCGGIALADSKRPR
jgi:Protein kinase domain